MAELMRVPEVATGTTEAILAEWLVSSGESVEVGSPVAVIETEKAQVEVEATATGVVLALLVPEASQVKIGAPLVVIGAPAEATGDLDQLLAGLGVGAAPVVVPAPERRELATVDQEAVPSRQPALSAAPAPSAARQFVSPIARRLLRDAGIDPLSVQGSGPGGRVVRADVEAAIVAVPTPSAPGVGLEQPTAPQAPARTAGPAAVEPTRRPHSRIRRAVAKRLTSSKQTIPHFYLRRSARIDELLRLRVQLNEHADRRVSVNDFVLKAVANAHIAVHEANVIWTDEEMLQFETADIAVAIASQRGLVTPVLRSVERLSLGTISAQVKAFAEEANAGKLRQEDLEGGAISVTNLGMYGVEEFSAIINPPHASILAVGAAKATPVVVDGTIQVATLLPLTLSVDHRAIDGALAAQWMQALVAALENPFRLVL